MTTGLDSIAELIAAVRFPGRLTQADSLIRASLACLGFAALTERGEVPSWLWTAFSGEPRSSRGSMAKAEALATLAAAADLDPLDRGPAHLALPATVSAFVVGMDRGMELAAITEAVGVGVACGSRLREAVTGVRPGFGFHSASTFGLYAVTATVSRLLRLDGEAAADALAIALTRSSGLAVNGASTRIGLTHFGYAASHGIEAAMLAAEGWTASHRLDMAFLTLFGEAGDLDVLRGRQDKAAQQTSFYKHYPCNIYLNPVVHAVAGLGASPGEEIEVTLPPVRHLDNPSPVDIRALRNSAQGAVAACVLNGSSYRAFTADMLGLERNARRLSQQIGKVVVRFDESRATSLDEAHVTVRVGGKERHGRLDGFGPLEDIELRRLASGYEAEAMPWLTPLIKGDFVQAYQFITSALARENS